MNDFEHEPLRPLVLRDFVEQLIGTGIMLAGLVDDLVAAMPPDAYPGEALREVVVDMICGTVAPALEAAGSVELRAAHSLIGAVGDRTLADLEEAAARASAA